MATSITICSNALLMLGAQTISSFDEAFGDGALDRAKLCSNLYPEVRDDMLRAHPWNFATKRVTLAPTTPAPEFDYANAFNLPGDWLRTLQVGEKGYETDYETQGRQILSDDASLKLKYIYQNTVEGSWDSAFVHIMTLAMAARMAYAITQSATLEQTRLQELEQAMRKARALDGQDDPPQTFGDFRLLGSRFSRGVAR